LHGEKGEKDILGSKNAEVITQQLESSHKSIRVWMNLRRGQLGPTEHLSLEVGKREPETHVFENHFIHGKGMVFVLLAHLIRRVRKNQLPIFHFADGPKGNLTHSISSKADSVSRGSSPNQEETGAAAPSFAIKDLKKQRKK
jgi:hypothetical protein